MHITSPVRHSLLVLLLMCSLALFGAGCSSGTSKQATSQRPTASALPSPTATAFPTPSSSLKTILLDTPGCEDPSGTVWSSPSQTFSKICLFDFTGYILKPSATGELDLDSVNGRPYADATEKVEVSVYFGGDLNPNNPNNPINPNSSAVAGVALKTLTAAKTSAANTAGYWATVDTAGRWKLSRFVGDTSVTIAQGPIPTIVSPGAGIALELYRNHVYLWVDNVPMAVTPVVSDTPLGTIALVAANTSSQSSQDVEYSAFALLVSP